MIAKLICVLFAAVLAGTSCAQDARHDGNKNSAGHYERIRVRADSLAGNLSGEPVERDVSIYLPPSYAQHATRRYPVLYLLHGFTDSDSRWFGLEGPHFVHVPSAVDAAVADGAKEVIVVMPNAFTKYQGSLYSSSVVIGDWETFVTQELVAYVDAHYRTLAKPESRGLAGHSMGGYGTLRLAMKHPGIFSSIYAMSACCLGANLQPDLQMLARAAKVRSTDKIASADFMTKAMLASAAAWSPNPANPPLFLDLPIADGKLVPETLAAWSANAPLLMLHQYIPALRTYRAIAIDAGDKDPGIALTTRQLHEWLDRYEIEHRFEIYPGDHLNRIQRRLTSEVLPFFSQELVFDEQ